MNLSRKSIAYKLLAFPAAKYNYEYKTMTLCKLFWILVLHLLVWFGIVPAVVGGMLGWYISSLLVYTSTTLMSTLALVLYVVLMVGLGELVDRFRKRSHNATEPGIIRSYLHAVKQRMCPLITYVED
jgi:hypothetical protein